MLKTIVLYGIGAGLLIAAMRAVEYRWLVVEHSLEIYGGIVAAVFASLGIWLGLKLTRERVREVPVPVPAPRSPSPARLAWGSRSRWWPAFATC